MDSPLTWSAGEIARRVSRGDASASEVVEVFLERLEAVEPRVGAFLRRQPEAARRGAAAIDRRRAAGAPLGPLAGVPVAIKDNLSLEGRPLSCASRLLEGYVAPFSATAVERLLDADAVVVGQTNLDEFAMGSSTEHSALGVTRNPRQLSRVPGGSSGGSAAAVAAGAVPLALGSDTGGSVRQPAALTGVVGLKPSWGRVSRWGLVAFASSTDQVGPLARTVGDAALALSVIAGADRRDATCSAAPVPDYLASLEGGVSGLRVGRLAQVDDAELAADVRRSYEASLARLEALGAAVVEVSVPALDGALAAYYLLSASEASTNLARFDGVRYGRRAAGGAAEALAGLYRESRSAGFGPEVKRRILLGTFALSAGYHEAWYQRARGVAETLRRQLAAALQEADLLATPTAPGGAFPFGARRRPLAMYLSDVFTVPASLAGLPALALPCGRDAAGLPLSLQLVGRPFDEATVLAAGHALEGALDLTYEPLPGSVDRADAA